MVPFIFVSAMSDRRDKILALANVKRKVRNKRLQNVNNCTKQMKPVKQLSRKDIIIGLVAPLGSSGSDVSSDESNVDPEPKKMSTRKSQLLKVEDCDCSLTFEDILNENVLIGNSSSSDPGLVEPTIDEEPLAVTVGFSSRNTVFEDVFDVASTSLELACQNVMDIDNILDPLS